MIPVILFAQADWKFTHITPDEGLSTGTVNCTLKDSKGFIWIGTVDGLNRYDGYSLKIYKNDQTDSTSLSNNVINTLAEDSLGRIWIGTREGDISIFDWNTESFSHFRAGPNPGQLPTYQVKDIVIDGGLVLIGSQGGGLLIYDWKNNKFNVLNYDPENPASIASNTIFKILKDSPGKFWIGCHGNSLDLFDAKSLTFKHHRYNKAFFPPESNRKPLLKDTKGNIWIGTDGRGAVKYNVAKDSYEYFNMDNGLSLNIITAFYEDERGYVYIGTDGQGIDIYDPNTGAFTRMKSSLLNPESLSSDAVYEFYEDDSGVIWVSTFRGGVNIYSKYKYKFHTWKQVPGETNSLSFNSVIAITETRDGMIWIGTDGGGLDMLNPETNQIKHYQPSSNPHSISSNVAIALEEDRNGNLWVGTYAGGINKFDRKTGQFKHYLPSDTNPYSVKSKNIWTVLEDREGTIWIGELGGGLGKYIPEKDGFIHYQATGEPGALSNNLIFTLLEDTHGNLWVGTEVGGLNLLDRETEKFKVYKNDPEDPNSLPNNSIRALHEDRKGQLWIGTAQGMSIIDLKSMEVSNSPVTQLLSNPVINGILEDDQQNLWISTNKGLSKYNPETNEIINFSMADGLQGTEFNYTSSVRTHDGRMYFGGIKGMNDFHPNDVLLSNYQPKVVITDIRLFDESITKESGLLSSSLINLESLTLKHDQNVLAIEFAALDFASPLSIKYQYKLEGFNESWVNTTSADRQARYTNLDPGDYTLIIKATNSDGIISENERKLHITVLPPWWATLWFRISALIIILTAVIVISKWRRNQIKLQKQILQDKVDEATSQVWEQNKALQGQQESLRGAITDTNFVIKEAVESGNFSARIDTTNKEGEWRELGESINTLFDSILTPFTNLNQIINSMAESDLSTRYSGSAKGDVKRITENLNKALDNLSELLEEIISQTENIRSSSDEMMVTSEEMNVSTREIASSIAEMSRGAQSQVKRIDEASSILEGILRFSSDVGNQAKSINKAAIKGVEQSDTGKSLINKVDESMLKIKNVSEETNHAFGILSHQSEEISRVLSIIKEIAGQTNMLALNAAIEAAKAGESGRGFSVVAEQIRKLAESSGSSTTEIENMIDEIQSAIKNTARLFVEMGSSIEGGVEASQHASVSFQHLADSYSQTLQLSEKIVGATGQQTDDVRRVVELMEGVVVISEETAAGTEEIASSSSELSSGMSAYSEKTKTVSETVVRLQEKVNQFKLKD